VLLRVYKIVVSAQAKADCDSESDCDPDTDAEGLQRLQGFRNRYRNRYGFLHISLSFSF